MNDLSNIEQWRAENGENGACVVSDQDEPGTVMALCGRQQDAEEIAAALNNHRGAVDDLREVARLLDRSTQTGKAPTRDEWAALALANATLGRLGGQS